MARDRQSRGFQVFDLLTNLTADGIIRGLASAGAVFISRRLVTILWTKATGKKPPVHPEDPQVALPEAVGWAVLVAATMQTARILAIRAAESRLRSPDHEPADAASGLAAPSLERLCRALPADKLAIAVFGKLTPVVHKEAPGTRELVRLTRYHPERELLVRQVSPRQLQGLSNIVGVKIDSAR